ncbi:hypothetical protein JCM5350_002978 [Sporobolomyces pararoseus]
MDPAGVPLPPSAFSSRAPSRAVVPPSHLPLPPSHFPLLHSLLDSPQYRQTVEKHPELFRTSSYNPQPPTLNPYRQQGSLGRSSSARRPPTTPSSVLSSAWKRGKGRSSAQPNSGRKRTPSFPPARPLKNGGGGDDDLPRPVAVSYSSHSSQQRLLTPRAVGHESSNPSPKPHSNFARKVPSDSCISSVQLQRTDTSDSIRGRRDEKWEIVYRGEVPPLAQNRSSASLFSRMDPNLGDGAQRNTRQSVKTSRESQLRERRSMPPTSTPTYPFHEPLDLSVIPQKNSKTSSSFIDTIQQLKRMLNPSPSSPPSKSSRFDSRLSPAKKICSKSDDTLGSLGENGKNVKAKSGIRTGSTQIQRYRPPCHSSAHDFLSPRTSRSTVPRMEQKPVSKPLLARPPILAGATDLPSYLESRRQLLQLLREGPGADAARSSSVLQATIRSANDKEETSRRKPRFKWFARIQQSRRSKVEVWSNEERGVGQAERREKEKSLEREKSSTSLFQSRISNRPHSRHDRQSSHLSTTDSLGVANLPSSASLNLEERSTEAYSTYGERWEVERSGDFEERRIWDQWRRWIKERRDYLQKDK